MITLKSIGSFDKTKRYLERLNEKELFDHLERYAKEGVEALSSATPVESHLTANSWGYEIVHNKEQTSIFWTNSNVNEGVSIAIILQYGHGTGTGGYVEGRNYINPAIVPVMDKIADRVWKEVKRLG